MTATVTISIEIELGWGTHDQPESDDRLSGNRKPEIRALERSFSVYDHYSIAVIFDVGGHLLLQTCSGTHSGPYPKGWFDTDPASDMNSDPHFYAPDLVDAVVQVPTDHEICTHSFSYVLASEMPSKTIAQDVRVP